MLQYFHHLFLSMMRGKKSQKKSLMRCSLPGASYNFAIFVTKDCGQKIRKWWSHTLHNYLLKNFFLLPLWIFSKNLICQFSNQYIWVISFKLMKPQDFSPLCKNKLNRASKQHILTTTRTQQPNEPFFVVEKAIRHLWSVIWPDCQQPT